METNWIRKSARKSQPNSRFNNKDYLNPLTEIKLKEETKETSVQKNRVKNNNSTMTSTFASSNSLPVEKNDNVVKIPTPVANSDFITPSEGLTCASTRILSNGSNNITSNSSEKLLKEMKKGINAEKNEEITSGAATTIVPLPLKTNTPEAIIQDDEKEKMSVGEAIRQQLLAKNLLYGAKSEEIEQFFKTKEMANPQIITPKPVIIRRVVIEPPVPFASKPLNPGNNSRIHHSKIPYYGLNGFTRRTYKHISISSDISTIPLKAPFSYIKQADDRTKEVKNDEIRQQPPISSKIPRSAIPYRRLPRIQHPSKTVQMDPLRMHLQEMPTGDSNSPELENAEYQKVSENSILSPIFKATKYTGLFSLPIKQIFEKEKLSNVNPDLALKLKIEYDERKIKAKKEQGIRNVPFVPSKFAIIGNVVKEKREKACYNESIPSSGELTPIGEDTDSEEEGEELTKMVRVEYYGVVCEIPQTEPCRLCNSQMYLCNRKSRYRGELRAYPAYRCMQKGCQTFRSVRRVLELDPDSPFYNPAAVDRLKAPSIRRYLPYAGNVLKPYVPKPFQLMEMPEELKLQYEEDEKLSKLNLELRELLENDTLDLPQLQLMEKSSEAENVEKEEFVGWSEPLVCSSSSMSTTRESQRDGSEIFQEVKKEEGD